MKDSLKMQKFILDPDFKENRISIYLENYCQKKHIENYLEKISSKKP